MIHEADDLMKGQKKASNDFILFNLSEYKQKRERENEMRVLQQLLFARFHNSASISLEMRNFSPFPCSVDLVV